MGAACCALVHAAAHCTVLGSSVVCFQRTHCMLQHAKAVNLQASVRWKCGSTQLGPIKTEASSGLGSGTSQLKDKDEERLRHGLKNSCMEPCARPMHHVMCDRSSTV